MRSLIKPIPILTWLPSLLVLAVVSGPAAASFDPQAYSYKRNNNCVASAVADPIGVVLYGSAATPSRLFDNGVAARGDIHHHTGWTYHSSDGYFTQDALADGTCRKNRDADLATAAGLGNPRYHVRFWPTGGIDNRGRWYMVGTPHHEDWVPYPNCNKPPFGSHAVDKGAVDRGDDYRMTNGSGFDQGRRKLVEGYAGAHHHTLSYQYWGNTRSVKQCDGDYAGSNGNVAYVTVGRT